MTLLELKRFKSLLYSERYDQIMFLICVLYCVTGLPGLAVSDFFKNLVIFGTAPFVYFSYKESRCTRNVLFLLLISIFIQAASWVNSILIIPDYAKSYPDIKLLSSLFLFFLISFWIGENKTRRLIWFFSFLASFVVTIIVHDHYFDSFSIALQGGRVDFDLGNAQYTTMIAACSIMISVLLFFYIDNIKRRPLAFIILILSIFFCLFVFLVSQSRQIWLAFSILLLVFPAINYKKLGKKVTISLYSFLLVLFFSLMNTDIVEKRVADSLKSGDLDVVVRVLSGHWDDIPMTSFGIRFNSWIEASEWIKENPILGASKVAVKQVLISSDIFQSNPSTAGFGHLHNYYLETLVSFGFVGLFFIFCFYFVVSKNVLAHADYPTSIFFILFLLFWLFINNFESYNSKYYGIYIQNIILGAIFYIPKPNCLSE